MEEQEKVIALYNYVSAISEMRKKKKKRIEEEKWNLILEELPTDETISIDYDKNSGFSFVIRKKDFIKSLYIDEELLKWIEGKWSDYKSPISIKMELITESEDEKNSIIEELPEELEEKLRIEIEKRDRWVLAQKEIEKLQGIFNQIYIQYLDLKKESESLDLFLGNGIISDNHLKSVYYPILMRKVKIEFIAEKNIIKISEIEGDDSNESKLYTDFLTQLENINLENIFSLEKKIKEMDLHPLNKKESDIFFREFIHSLSINGYFFEEEKKYREEDILIFDKPLLFIKKRELDLVKNIGEIVSEIKNGAEIPKHLLELLGIITPKEGENVESDKKYTSKDPEILFIKESNKEQLDIAKQIKFHNAVVVQGPPGTGKTHTIVNLLGHFLSQGKNILVTSETPKALRVLKEKIPKNIQGLCVSVLDSNKGDMRQSVESISEKMGIFTSTKLWSEAENYQKIREAILEEIEEKKKKISLIKFQEQKNIVYNGENFSVMDAAIFVRENERKLNKIPGNIKRNIPCPITNEDVLFLQKGYSEKISKEEEKEINLGLQKLDIFLKSEEYEELIIKKNTYLEDLRKMTDGKEWFIEEKCLYLNGKKVIILEKFQQDIKRESLLSDFEDIKEWQIEASIAGMRGSIGKKKKWENFIKEIEDLHQRSEEVENKFFKVKIEIQNYSLETAKKLVEELKNAIQNPGFLFKSKLKLAKENIGDSVLINHKIIESIEECCLILDYINFSLQKKDVQQTWDLLLGNYGGLSSENISEEEFPDIAYQFIPKIQYFLNWDIDKKDELLSYLGNIGVELKSILPVSDTEIQRLRNFILSISEIKEIINIGGKALSLNIQLEEIEFYSKKIKNNLRWDSNWDQKLNESLENEDVNQYQNCLYELENLNKKREFVDRRKKILEDIKRVAINLEQAIQNEKLFTEEDNIYDIWKWKQLFQILEELSTYPYERLQEDVIKKENALKRVTTELVEKKAWYHVLSFIEKKENLHVHQALRGWSQSVQKIGKGTGKNVALYRKQAKEKMKVCQKAVPIWIMPISIVLDTLNPIDNKFDIIIVDEASQSDLTSLILLYMAKKIIIVGDDRQVSPLNVGTQIEEVNLLREKYIKGKISNDDLYGLNSSLYSIATTTYQPLMLREHFRCVPDIIGYSNRTSYDYKIKPLREANSSNIKPAVINYRVEGHRDANGKKNIIEAKTIVSLMEACMEQPEYANLSFGVISLLGNEQTEYIQKLIVEKIGESKIEKHQILCGNPSHFQGDEKDVIFLSMVDSNENKEGPLRLMSVGVEEANKKRYNVALSRAKDQVWIVHSLDSDNDLKAGDLRKELLEYSLDPNKFIDGTEIEQNSDSIFEKEVATYLAERGYNVIQQWKVGAYRIDMVVSFEGRRIAVECDGEKWHSSEEQIQNDMNRQEILERCGWNFIRIRGSRYFSNPDKTMKEIISQLKEKEIYPEIQKNTNYQQESFDFLNKIKNRAFGIRNSWEESRETIGTLQVF